MHLQQLKEKQIKVLNKVCERRAICQWKVYERGTFFKAKRGIGVEPRGGACPYKHLLSTPRGFEMCAFIKNELGFPLVRKKIGGKLKSWFQCVNNLFVERNL